SPTRTFQNWGSSSSLSLRSTRPTAVTRGSSRCAQTSCAAAPFTRIVRNLYMVNVRPPESAWRRKLPPALPIARRSTPIRRCVNSTAPGAVLLLRPLMTPRPLPAIRGQSAPAVLRRGGASDRTSLPEEEAAPDWRRIVSVLLRFKWVVILMLALGLGAGFAATRVLRPVYRAQANVW